MKIVCIVQARLHSTRLPGKVLLPLAGRPLLWRLLERIQRAKLVGQILVTCPINDVLTLAPAIPDGIAIDPWVGDEHDLVGRHLSAARWAHADLIVRIPSDNPLVDPTIIDEAIETYLGPRPHLYLTTMYRQVRDRVYVDGVGAEVFSLSCLQWLDQATRHAPQYREHPHLLFQDQHLIDGFEQYQRYANYSETIRLDVNTQADYDFIADIYDALYPTNPHFGLAEILAYLARKPVPA